LATEEIITYSSFFTLLTITETASPELKTVGDPHIVKLLGLSFSRDVLTVTDAYGSFRSVFTWKISAFKTQSHAFVKRARSYLAHFILPGYTSSSAVGAQALLHPWTFLASYSANTDFHTSHTSYFARFAINGFLGFYRLGRLFGF
jgi:hypothetical protein